MGERLYSASAETWSCKNSTKEQLLETLARHDFEDVDIRIQKVRMARCPACNQQVLLKEDGTFAKHFKPSGLCYYSDRRETGSFSPAKDSEPSPGSGMSSVGHRPET